ncbi:hypothetical protein DFH06DRAFT_1173122 [Mycena polygramma]|nr:hypothetical protein DFH06DRAFT_1173122 [Mycena polygramma]
MSTRIDFKAVVGLSPSILDVGASGQTGRMSCSASRDLRHCESLVTAFESAFIDYLGQHQRQVQSRSRHSNSTRQNQRKNHRKFQWGPPIIPWAPPRPPRLREGYQSARYQGGRFPRPQCWHKARRACSYRRRFAPLSDMARQFFSASFSKTSDCSAPFTI